MEKATPTLVVDASVAAKWFIPEEGTDKSLVVRDRYIEGDLDLVAPDLLVYEVANALRYRADLEDSKLKEDLEALFLLDLELVPPSQELVTRSVAAARRLDISVYDALYLALAETLSANLLTADQELYAKARKAGALLLSELGERWSLP